MKDIKRILPIIFILFTLKGMASESLTCRAEVLLNQTDVFHSKISPSDFLVNGEPIDAFALILNNDNENRLYGNSNSFNTQFTQQESIPLDSISMYTTYTVSNGKNSCWGNLKIDTTVIISQNVTYNTDSSELCNTISFHNVPAFNRFSLSLVYNPKAFIYTYPKDISSFFKEEDLLYVDQHSGIIGFSFFNSTSIHQPLDTLVTVCFEVNDTVCQDTRMLIQNERIINLRYFYTDIKKESIGSKAICAPEDTCTTQDTLIVEYLYRDTLCYGFKGFIRANVTGGSPPYHYQWEHTPRNVSRISDLPPGEYPIRITDSEGCSLSDTISLVEAEPVTVEVTKRIYQDSCQDLLYFKASGGIKIDPDDQYFISIFDDKGNFPDFFVTDSIQVYEYPEGHYKAVAQLGFCRSDTFEFSVACPMDTIVTKPSFEFIITKRPSEIDSNRLLVNIQVNGFVDIEAYAVNFNWNPYAESLISIRSEHFPIDLTRQKSNIDNGKYFHLWLDGILEPLTLPDSTTILQFEFQKLESEHCEEDRFTINPFITEILQQEPQTLGTRIIEYSFREPLYSKCDLTELLCHDSIDLTLAIDTERTRCDRPRTKLSTRIIETDTTPSRVIWEHTPRAGNTSYIDVEITQMYKAYGLTPSGCYLMDSVVVEKSNSLESRIAIDTTDFCEHSESMITLSVHDIDGSISIDTFLVVIQEDSSHTILDSLYLFGHSNSYAYPVGEYTATFINQSRHAICQQGDTIHFDIERPICQKQISGIVETINNIPLSGVELDVYSDSILLASVLTNEQGGFVLSLPDSVDNIDLRTKAFGNPYDGVSINDIINLRRQILGLTPENDTTTYLGNVNNYRTDIDLSVVDIVTLIRLILRNLEENNSWTDSLLSFQWNFFKQEDLFVDSLSDVFPINIDDSKDHFLRIVGAKKGDLDLSYGTPTNYKETLALQIQNRPTVFEDTLLVPIFLERDIPFYTAMQLSFELDRLELIEIIPGQLFSEWEVDTNVFDGHLFCFDYLGLDNNLILRSDEPLFTLKLRTLSTHDLQTLLTLSEKLVGEIYAKNGNEIYKLELDIANEARTIDKRSNVIIDKKPLVYPNPFTNEFIVEFTGQQSNALIEVYNTVGQRVHSVYVQEGKHKIRMDHHDPGVYLLHVIAADERYIYKLIRQ